MTSWDAVGRRRFTPEDVAAQVVPGQVGLHGDRVVYTLRQVDDRGERTDLWTVSLRGGDQRRLTDSLGRDHTPRISPDGRRLAFLRSAEGRPTRIHLLDLGDDGVASRRLDAVTADAHDLAWSPDGAWLVVLADDESSDVVVGAGPGSPTALVLRRVDWRADGSGDGGLRLRPRHLHRVPVDGTAAPVRLTSGPWSASRPRVGPDGTVYFLADPGPSADLRPVPQVYCVPSAGGGPVRACTDLPGGALRFHLAGTRLRVLGFPDGPRHEDDPPRIVDLDPDSPPGPLPPAPSGWLGRLGEESDLHDWQLALDDAAELTTMSAHGSTVPIEVTGGRTWVTGPAVCGAVAAHGDGRVAVLSLGSGLVAPDVYALGADGPRRLTRHGAWTDAFAAPRRDEREVPGPAGQISVHLLLPPDGVEPRGTVVSVHGGPVAQWGVVPPLEAVVLAAAGYRVAMPNIRGSIDRDAGWARALADGWGEADAADVLAVCDDLEADGGVPDGRLGLLGLSYGGFLVQWLIGVTDRFAAAVAENGVANQVAAWGSSDAGPSFSEAARLGSVVSAGGVEQLWACSPLRNVERVRTPLLILQGADDRTCPASDNEQLFVALRALGREVEYVLYPEESHGMQATARLDRRIDRHRRMLTWFDTHLAR